MAFPSPTGPTATTFLTSVTSMAVNMPATVDSGDLLLAFVHVRNAGSWTTVPTNWNAISTVSQAGGGSVGKLNGFYKIADGTEDGGTATWITDTSTTAVWHVIRVTSWDGTTPPEGATASGDFSAVDAPNLAPSWGSADTLWVWSAGNSATIVFVSGAPSSYSGYQKDLVNAGGASVNLAYGYQQLTASSENPASVSTNVRWWAAATIAVKPAGSTTTSTSTSTSTSSTSSSTSSTSSSSSTSSTSSSTSSTSSSSSTSSTSHSTSSTSSSSSTSSTSSSTSSTSSSSSTSSTSSSTSSTSSSTSSTSSSSSSTSSTSSSTSTTVTGTTTSTSSSSTSTSSTSSSSSSSTSHTTSSSSTSHSTSSTSSSTSSSSTSTSSSSSLTTTSTSTSTIMYQPIIEILRDTNKVELGEEY